MKSTDYGQQEGESTANWLRRLIAIGAPADVRANAQAILESERSQPQPGGSAVGPADWSKYPYMSKFLIEVGIETPYEQYGFYFSVATFFGVSFRALVKAYWMNKYIHETDIDAKSVWAMRGGFNEVELRGAKTVLKAWRATPRRMALMPITFLVVEVGRQGWKRITESKMSKT